MPPFAKWIGLACWLAVSFLPALSGVVAQADAWYDGLSKPFWNPPPWLFGPVWTALYVAMGVAAWRVWAKAGGFAQAKTALGVYLFHLMLNGAWTLLFFGAHEMGWAFAEILVLWLAIAATIWLFLHHSTLAAVLLVPYLAWVTFAAALNFTIWQIN